jgi:hypothetical protein
MWVAIQTIDDSGALYKVLAAFYEALHTLRESGDCGRADRTRAGARIGSHTYFLYTVLMLACCKQKRPIVHLPLFVYFLAFLQHLQDLWMSSDRSSGPKKIPLRATRGSYSIGEEHASTLMWP